MGGAHVTLCHPLLEAKQELSNCEQRSILAMNKENTLAPQWALREERVEAKEIYGVTSPHLLATFPIVVVLHLLFDVAHWVAVESLERL